MIERIDRSRSPESAVSWMTLARDRLPSVDAWPCGRVPTPTASRARRRTMARVPSLFSPGGLMMGRGDPFLILHREIYLLFDDALRGSPAVAGSQGQGA